MIHYHGTPVGGKAADAAAFIQGRAVLIPWKRPDELERACKLSRQFCVDNSAFSFWKSGEKPDWSAYVKWCKQFARHPRFDFAIAPDVIDGSEEENDELLRWWDKRVWHPMRIRHAAVWHLHESLDRLRRLCERHQIVCFGSSGEYATPGTDRWWGRMQEAMPYACDENGFPLARLHGLRMLRPSIVEAFPWSSCDSTMAVQNGTREGCRIGTDSHWGRMTLARKIEAAQSPCVLSRAVERQGALFV